MIQKIEITSFDTVMTSTETGISGTEFTVDLSSLTDGLYLLSVGEEATERLLILK